MPRRPALLAAALLLLAAAPRPAAAQVSPASCSGSDWDLYLRMGPTLSPLVTLQGDGLRLEPGFMLRVGILAGLPLQLETMITPASLAAATRGSDAFAVGVRVLPVSWSPSKGFRHGGTPGHNVGAVAGLNVVGYYVGAVYEWIVLPEAGVVAEYTQAFGGLLRQDPSLNVGLKFQVPIVRPVE